VPSAIIFVLCAALCGLSLSAQKALSRVLAEDLIAVDSATSPTPPPFLSPSPTPAKAARSATAVVAGSL